MVIVAIDRQGNPETVVISNTAKSPQDMTGWILFSVTGSQRFAFPSGYVLAPGTGVTIQSGPRAKTTPPQVLLWTTKYMWNNEEADEARLLDPKGNAVSIR